MGGAQPKPMNTGHAHQSWPQRPRGRLGQGGKGAAGKGWRGSQPSHPTSSRHHQRAAPLPPLPPLFMAPQTLVPLVPTKMWSLEEDTRVGAGVSPCYGTDQP